jgi:branched-chain amino acid transport system ATP-binding protein
VTWEATRVLEIGGLEAGYGDVRVLSGVTLSIAPGEIVALLGPNGAGKSTLLNCVAGLVRPWAGAIRWDGQDLRAVDAHLVVERGIALVPEGRRLFAGMTVQENLELGAFASHAWAGRRAALEHVYTLFPVLAERRRTVVQALSGGQQQMVAVGRALMARPRLLMLDEPSLGLAPRLVAAILEGIGAINGAGVAVFLVEQNVPAALSLAHRGYVLEGGRIVGEGSGAALMADAHVRRAYLGPLAVRPT